MTTLRAARLTDLNALVALGRVMHAESPRMSKLGYVDIKVKATLCGLLNSPDGLLLVAEENGEIVGGIAATVQEHYFSNDRMAYDLAFFISPEKRGGLAAARLLDAYKLWGKERGAAITQFGISTGVNVTNTARLAEKRGFAPAGVLLDAVN